MGVLCAGYGRIWMAGLHRRMDGLMGGWVIVTQVCGDSGAVLVEQGIWIPMWRKWTGHLIRSNHTFREQQLAASMLCICFSRALEMRSATSPPHTIYAIFRRSPSAVVEVLRSHLVFLGTVHCK